MTKVIIYLSAFLLLFFACKEPTEQKAIVESYSPKTQSINQPEKLLQRDSLIKEAPIVPKEKLPIKEVLSLKIDVDSIEYQGVPFISTIDKMKERLGSPDSIIEPKYECGPFSEDWQEMKFYQYFYGTMNFIVYQNTTEIQDINLRQIDLLKINNVYLKEGMSFYEVAKKLKIEINDNSDKDTITLFPKNNADEWYFLEFQNNKLVRFDRYEPC